MVGRIDEHRVSQSHHSKQVRSWWQRTSTIALFLKALRCQTSLFFSVLLKFQHVGGCKQSGRFTCAEGGFRYTEGTDSGGLPHTKCFSRNKSNLKLTLSTCSKKSIRNPTTDVFLFNWIVHEEDRMKNQHPSIIIHFVFKWFYLFACSYLCQFKNLSFWERPWQISLYVNMNLYLCSQANQTNNQKKNSKRSGRREREPSRRWAYWWKVSAACSLWRIADSAAHKERLRTVKCRTEF